MKRFLTAAMLVAGFLFIPVPAAHAVAWDCNAYRVDSFSVYRYCRESCDYGEYYVWVKLSKYDPAQGGIVFQTKQGTWQLPGGGSNAGSYVSWNDNVWNLYDKATRAVNGCN